MNAPSIGDGESLLPDEVAASSVDSQPDTAPVDSLSSGTAGEHSLQSEARTAGRHSLVYLLAPVLWNLISFVLIPIYTRYIDRSRFGIMSLVDSLMAMSVMILSLGMSDGLNRFYYLRPDEAQRRRLVSTALCGPALLGLPFVLAAMYNAERLAAWLQLEDGYSGYLGLAVLTTWFAMMMEIGFVYLRLLYRSRAFVALSLFHALVAAGLNLWFVVGCRWDIWGILYSTLITHGILGIGLLVAILVEVRAWPNWRDFRELFAFGIHLVPATVSLQMANYLAPLMIRWRVPGDGLFVLSQVGLFSTGQRLSVLPNRFVTVPFLTFWRPRRMELLQDDSPVVRNILARICTYSTLFTAQAALLLSVSARGLLEAMVEKSYWDAWRVVPWLALSYVFICLEQHFTTGLQYVGKTHWATWISAVSLALLVAVNWVGLPLWGMEVAAVATLLGICLRTWLFYAVSQHYFRIPFEVGRLLGMIGVCVLLYLVSLAVPGETWWLRTAGQLLCGLALPVVLWAIGYLDTQEKQMVRQWWSDAPRMAVETLQQFPVGRRVLAKWRSGRDAVRVEPTRDEPSAAAGDSGKER